MIYHELSELGLTQEEAKVYLTTLELGTAYASVIAKKAGMPRVNCYYVLEKLIEKGLISTTQKGNIRQFSAVNPRRLVNIEQEKLNTAKRILPELLSITNKLAFKPKIHFFEGEEGIKTIYEDTLTAKGEVIGYTNLKALIELFPEYLAQYVRKKLERKIKTRLLSPWSEEGIKYHEKYYPKNFDRNLSEILFVNPKEFNFENEINIYENKIAIMSLNPEELIGILIESSVLARTQKAIFDLSWIGATAFVAR